MANFNFNKVIIGGRLTSDPELKNTASGTNMTSFSVAVNRRFGGKNGEENTADFISVTAWRQTAEFITRYFKKASSICIVGTLQTRNWTDNDGNKHYVTEVVADEAYFVDSKNESQPTAAPTNYVPSAYTEKPVMVEIEDDELLPF
jgi:single-strand DNA-binding protein